MVRKLEIGQTHTDVRGVIHQPLAVGHPRARVSHVRDITGPGSRRPAIVDVTATSIHLAWISKRVIPPDVFAGGLAAAVIIGALAGLLPAIRAARLSPTPALWTV
jgi:ABC-type antimicrobial peptide transport system permease subunit